MSNAMDPLGTPIEVGSKVVWVGGKGQYSNVKVRTVDKITNKCVVLSGTAGGYISQHAVIVVDKIIQENSENV